MVERRRLLTPVEALARKLHAEQADQFSRTTGRELRMEFGRLHAVTQKAWIRKAQEQLYGRVDQQIPS